MTFFRLASTASAAAALALALAGPARAEVPAPVDAPYPGTLVLNVDATDLSQQIFRVHMTIPVKPGPLTLLYPQWLPANHGPNGPITQLAGLKFTANGRPVEWKRDPLHVYAFHLDVPAGATALEADYQYLAPLEAGQGRNTMTDDILGVQWISTTLYPAGHVARGVNVQANLKLPAGWQYATALETEGRAGDDVHFRTSDLETLLDSPLFAGRYGKRYDLDPNGKVRVTLNVFADSPDSLDAKPEQIAAHRALVQQAYKLYGSHHYDHYDFLFALSDEFGGIGREHHQSSENGVKPGYFTDWAKNEAVRDLLPHEFTHSWNGKFRRPAGQNVPNFNTPMDNELLWVYEGQTQYWGNVLAARSGLVSSTGARDALAASAARYDSVAGRAWRAVQDTVYDPILNARRGLAWPNWQRSEDYYVEGMLIWLDVDTRIRELSGEKRSLDDFARAFYGVNDGSHLPAFYTFEDVVATLNRVQPYDWAAFLRAKLDGHGPGAPLDGLARAGWKLVYTDTPTDYLKADDERRKSLDLTYSLGFTVAQDGAVRNVVWDGLAFRAGLAANATVMAVNDRVYKPELLTAAVKAAKDNGQPIRLLVRKGSVLRTVALDYRGGLRYPRLERIPGTKDRLDAILAARK